MNSTDKACSARMRKIKITLYLLAQMSFNNCGIFLKATAFYKTKSFDCNWSWKILRNGTTTRLDFRRSLGSGFPKHPVNNNHNRGRVGKVEALINNGFPETSGKNDHYIFSERALLLLASVPLLELSRRVDRLNLRTHRCYSLTEAIFLVI